MVQKRSVMGGTLRLAFALALAAAIPAAAIIDCSKIPEEPPPNCSTPMAPEFKEPPVIEAKCDGQPCQPGQPGAINTTFCLKIREQCVPGSTRPLKLRTYVYPDPKNPQKWIYGFPGPTLKLRKAFTSNPSDRGDTVAILLDNQLPADSSGCNSACPATVTCPDRSKLPNPSEKCGGNSPDPLCCCWVNVNQHLPDCMHGDNTTNLHLHGSHISPQSPQDYVLLELHPAAGKGKELHRMTARSNLQAGTFQYKTDPFPFNQSEGTHWYHPHKHGSVSLQVANGMAGALIILGPFDQWLNDYYAKQGTKLTEKILIAQQIQEDTNLFGKGGSLQVLINGQLKPKLTVLPGEVQRWRVVNATLQKSGQLTITFPVGSQAMQIAQDGVQFAPKTYADQPLLKDGKFSLSPGNRADFLVRMPLTPTTVHMTQRVFGNLSARAREKVQLRDQRAKDLSTGNEAEAPILTIEVVAPPQGEANAQAVPKGFPSMEDWPKTPEHLKDIQPNEIKGHQKLVFSMNDHTGAASGAGNPATMFFINDLQYNPHCVNVTTELGTADEWYVENSSDIEHPFHIHTNPFQLVEQGAMINGKATPSVKYDPPIWFDTIAIPTPATDVVSDWRRFKATEAEIKAQCPVLCKEKHGVWNGKGSSNWVEGYYPLTCECTFNGYVKLLHRYLDFTGEYVLHCHFLGHEDRGMMFGVQTVCKNDPTKFGNAKADGSPECVSGNFIDAAPHCQDQPVKASSSHAH